MWFGVYPTWEGVLLQLAAFVFVIGSYLAAEAVRKRRRNRVFTRPPCSPSRCATASSRRAARYATAESLP